MGAAGRDHEGFTLGLALADAVPVALFGASALIFGRAVQSPVFLVGALVCLASGIGKVRWKLLLALSGQDVPLLSRQMRYLMPLGFVLMACGVVLGWDAAAGALARLMTLPSALLVGAWVACMAGMGYLAGHRDQASAHDNWVEEGVNSLGQAALLAALLLALG